MARFRKRAAFTMVSMKKQNDKTGAAFFRVINILLLALTLAACAAPAAATDIKIEFTDTAAGAASANAGVMETMPSAPPPILTPPALPASFQTQSLNPLDTPRAYIQEPCKYLRARWNPSNAEPGTVVMIIMLRDVYSGTVDSFDGVEIGELKRIMKQLKAQGFEAINMEKFHDFMERNIKIPPRSALIIRDGNYGQEDFYGNFRPYWEAWKWTIVNGWSSRADTPENVWQENILMEYEGFVDHQAHGVQPGAYLTDDSSKVVIARELQGSLDAFAGRFGKTPVAFIWPNGGFGQRPAEIARQLKYQLGFTLNSRGPVMYNWVPLADQVDPQRPSYLPEGALKDPLMTLPRYWPDQVLSSIDTVRVIGNDAKAYAEANQAAELEYYQIACEPTYGPIPALPK
jgi:hypothetical protein